MKKNVDKDQRLEQGRSFQEMYPHVPIEDLTAQNSILQKHRVDLIRRIRERIQYNLVLERKLEIEHTKAFNALIDDNVFFQTMLNLEDALEKQRKFYLTVREMHEGEVPDEGNQESPGQTPGQR